MLLGIKYPLNRFIHLGEGRGSAEGGERESAEDKRERGWAECGEWGQRDGGRKSAFSCLFLVWETESYCVAQARPELSVIPLSELLPAGMSGVCCPMWLVGFVLFPLAGSHTSVFAALPSSAGRVSTAVSSVALEFGWGLAHAR